MSQGKTEYCRNNELWDSFGTLLYRVKLSVKTAFALCHRVRLSAAEIALGYCFTELRLSFAETALGYCIKQS